MAASGHIYFPSQSNTIVEYNNTNEIVFAGVDGQPGSVEDNNSSPAYSNARLNDPFYAVLGANGHLYVTDFPNFWDIDTKESGYVYSVLLPLKIVSFAATVNGNNINCDWEITEAKDLSHFILETSHNAKDFNKASDIFALSTLTRYSATLSSKSQPAFIRLCVLDNNGKKTYGPVVSLKYNYSSLKITLANNYLQIGSPVNEKGIVTLITADGKIIMRQNIILQQGENNFSISQRHPGQALFIKLTGDKSGITTQKLIIP